MILIIVVAVVAAVMFLGFGRTVRIVPQARAYVVERLGSYSRTLDAGLNSVVPFIDRVRARVDLREQVVSFAPQPVITEDNLVVHIDTVLYFQVTDPRAATYEIANFIQAIEQLTVTTPRNVIGAWTWKARSPPASRSTPNCAESWTRPPGSGASGSTGSN